AGGGRAVRGPDEPREGERAARLRDGLEDERLLARPAADDQQLRPQSFGDPDASAAHRCDHAAGAAGSVQEILPLGSRDDRHVTAGDSDKRQVGATSPYLLSNSRQRAASVKISVSRSPSKRSRRRS